MPHLLHHYYGWHCKTYCAHKAYFMITIKCLLPSVFWLTRTEWVHRLHFLLMDMDPDFLMDSFISRCLDFMQKSIGYALIVIFQSDTKLKSRENLGWGEHGYLLHKVFQKSGVSHKFQASKSYFRTLSTWCASTSEPAHLLMMKPQFNYSKNWWYWSSLSSKILLLENQCQENYYQFLCVSSLPHW